MSCAEPSDAHWMREALRLASKGQFTVIDTPLVGCVLVKDGQAIGCGWHRFSGQAHAEADAIASATVSTKGATAYVTLAPCTHHGRTPPCTDALLQAGVERVVIGADDTNPVATGAGEVLKAAGIAVTTGVLEAECRFLNRGFFSRIEKNRPWVTLKTAQSFDGKMALSTGESQWITGPEARQDVQRLRAQQQALITSVQTIQADDALFTVRMPLAGCRPPLRVVIDSRATLSLRSRFVQQAAPILWCVGKEAVLPKSLPPHVELLKLPKASTGRPCLNTLLRHLTNKGLNRVLVEAGSRLSRSFLQLGLVDEWVRYTAPVMLGETAQSGPSVLEPSLLSDCVKLAFTDVVAIGHDIRTTVLVRSQEA